ncbi:hypothetical protein [Psychrobacter jeotgali]|uniref:hypothetical protein n=1 Tax=Psychrobacter jeotgali TaxID=179010 RepID=UPI00191B814B|nr:hypothetical protein [Psychrobacter jeotgali]
MDIVLAIIWILAMVLYSFSSDYAHHFPAHNNRALPFIRWGSLLVAIALSVYLTQVYQQNLQDTGIWIFIAVVFVIITVSKLIFQWVLKRRR